MPGTSADGSTVNAYASRVNDTGTAFAFWTVDSEDDANWKTMGDADFNTVLVADADVQGAIVASAAKPNGLYRMDDAYNVIVVPSGIAGSWAAGHLDSFLLAPWAFRVQSEANLDAAGDYAKSFYETFLRCEDWSGAVSDWNASEVAR